MDGVGIRQHPRGKGMPAFVVGDYLLLPGAYHPASSLRSGHCSIGGILKLLQCYVLAVTAGSQDRGFIDEIGQVGSAESGRTLGNGLQIGVPGQRLAFAVHLQNRLAALYVGQVDYYVAVEAAGTEQGRIEDVGAVGGSHDDDVDAGIEAIHLGQNLVERLFPFVVSSAETCSTVSAYRVYLVNEHQARRVTLGLLKQVSDPGRPHTDEHLDELTSTDREERHPGLSRYGLGQQSLARSRRAYEEHTPWNTSTKGLEFLGSPKELHYFLNLLFGLLCPGDIGECNIGSVVETQSCLALAEVKCLSAGPARGAKEEEVEQGAEKKNRQEYCKGYRAPVESALNRVELYPVGAQVHSLAFQVFDNGVRIGSKHRCDSGLVVSKSGQCLAVMVYPVYLLVSVFLALSRLNELEQAYLLRSSGQAVQGEEDESHHCYQQQHVEEATTPPFCLHVTVLC